MNRVETMTRGMADLKALAEVEIPDMKGKVRPVVGMRPSDTAICMKAVRPMTPVSPTARYCPNGSVVVRAIRKPSQQKTSQPMAHLGRAMVTSVSGLLVLVCPGQPGSGQWSSLQSNSTGPWRV